jgi:hypothetical protein
VTRSLSCGRTVDFGLGKTHTIHYLARFLEGHTTLVVAVEQVGILGEYMTLDEMLFSGGSLKLKLLGAQGAESGERIPSHGSRS